MIKCDEDAAFAAAQLASGVPPRDIAYAYGYKSEHTVIRWIWAFVRKYVSETEIAFADTLWSLIPKAILAFKWRRAAAFRQADGKPGDAMYCSGRRA